MHVTLSLIKAGLVHDHSGDNCLLLGTYQQHPTVKKIYMYIYMFINHINVAVEVKAADMHGCKP